MQNYGSKQVVLNQKLAYFLLCNPENVNLLNGVSQIYPILQTLYKEERVLIPEPTFGEFPRIFKNAYTYSDRVGVKKNEIEARAKDCGVVVFVNPNNPTGTVLESSYIYEYAARNPGKTVLVDESFIDFSGLQSMLNLLEKDPLGNVIVIKSLSKALGVPGIRAGFCYTQNSEFNKQVREVLPIWNSNSIAEFFFEIILKHKQSLAQSFVLTINDRVTFGAELALQPYVEEVYQGGANFILVKFKKNENLAGLVTWLLARHSYYIKDVSGKFSDGCYYARLAVRFPEENHRLIEYMREYFDRL